MSQQMKKMLKVVGIIFGLLIIFYLGKRAVFSFFMSHYVPPPVTISASAATATNWQSYVTSVGTLTAVNGVDISPETSGIVKEIRFQSGQFVKKGDVLILLDTSIEEAQLKDSLSQAKLAKINYLRNKELMSKKAVSQSQLDTLAAQLDEAIAGVEQVEARIRQKTITAPFDGKIGIRMIDIGQFVSAGTKMVTLQALDPLFVRFNLPERYLSELYLQQPIALSVNLAKSKTLMGAISAIDAKVDQSTRSILVQAIIPNKNLELYPGMFSLVKVMLRAQKDVITLPQTSIAYSLHGDSVFLLKEIADKTEKPSKISVFFSHLFGKKEDKKDIVYEAYRQYVKVGERRDDKVSILDGIKAGDLVVTSGQLKLQNGMHVVIDNSVEL